MLDVKCVTTLPFNKVTQLTKPQADALKSMAESAIKTNNSVAACIGVAGAVAILTAIVTLIQNHDNNKHEERMKELEIEKLKVELENHKNKEEVLL